MKNRIFYLLGLSLLAACSKDAATDNRLMAYEQTYCADPWDKGSADKSDEGVLEKVTAYLQNQGIAAASVSIRAVNPGEGCNACSCRSGKVIYATVNNALVDRMKAVGFK